jgi:hypothetical protein
VALAIYRCPYTMNIRLVTADVNVRIRAGELYCLDDADSDQVDAFDDAGIDISLEVTDPLVTEIGGPDDPTPHNPFNLEDA